jgi:cytochrome b561
MASGDAIADGRPAYSVTARTFHWLTAALILTTLPIALAMNRIPESDFSSFIYQLHKSLGFAILLVMTLRIIYRFAHPPLPIPHSIPWIYRFAGEATHWMLYVAVIAQALLGWIATSAYPGPMSFFGLFTMPPIWREDNHFSEQLFVVHRNLGYLIGLLLCAHIGGALFHYFIRRDGVLQRMVTGRQIAA